MTYSVTGDPGLLKRLINAHDYFVQTQCYVTGGFGPGEKLMAPDGSLGESIVVEPNKKYLAGNHGRSFETPCGTWAVFKLCDYLLQFTGEARFGDWMERALYNGILAALPMTGHGTTFYYADYRISGASKQYYNAAWPCCSGTFIQDVSQYLNLIYYKDQYGLLVNLYVPSEVTWQHDGQAVTVTQHTEYPASDKTELEIKTCSSANFAIRLRVPLWAEAISLSLNGQPLNTACKPGDWATVRRTWSAGDRLTARIPLALRLVPIDAQHPNRVAVACGPVALVHVDQVKPIATRSEFSKWAATDKSAVELTLPDRSSGRLRPFFTAAKGEAYQIYFDLKKDG